jgi:plastocyanin domain-containing protein
VATAKLSEGWHQKFTRIAAAALIIMALYSVNGILVVWDAPLTLGKIVRPVTWFFSSERFESNPIAVTNGVQQVSISVLNNGYNPKFVTVQAGLPVNLTLTSQDTYSCALAFVFKEFGINTFLEATDSQSFSFTPTKPGKYTFTCSMGMYSGVMEVI